MRRNLSLFAAALLSGLLAVALLSPANAGSLPASSLSSINASPALLQLAGYYSDGYSSDDDGGDGYKYSRRYHQKRYYDNDDDGDDGYDGYRRHKKHYEYNGCGYHKRWKRRYVCDEPSPRCFKQRECIWSYGREYCTYVRKCIGGEQYCRWKSVPTYSTCGDD